MKRLFAIIFLIMVLAVSYSFAQTGHGMMRGGHMGEVSQMMDDQGMKGLKDIFQENHRSDSPMTMEHRHMMNNMMGATQDMAIVMRQMSVIMGNITDTDSKTSRDKLHRVSGLMKNMSAEMNRISDLIAKGNASDEEMTTLQKRMTQIQQEMWDLK